MPRDVRTMLLGAVALSLLLAATWFLAFHVGFGERADARLFDVFIRRHRSWHVYRATALASLPAYFLLCLVPIAIALYRKRFVLAATVAAILIGANGVTLALKLSVPAPHPRGLLINGVVLGSSVWPSGHTTAAAALALCFVIAVPAVLRPAAAAAGIVYVLLICYAVLALRWHYPSDAFSGILVSSIVALTGLAVCRVAEASLAQIKLKRSQRPSGVAVATGDRQEFR